MFTCNIVLHWLPGIILKECKQNCTKSYLTLLWWSQRAINCINTHHKPQMILFTKVLVAQWAKQSSALYKLWHVASLPIPQLYCSAIYAWHAALCVNAVDEINGCYTQVFTTYHWMFVCMQYCAIHWLPETILKFQNVNKTKLYQWNRAYGEAIYLLLQYQCTLHLRIVYLLASEWADLKAVQ